MIQKNDETLIEQEHIEIDSENFDRNKLALDSLSKLAKQFSDKPDFKNLIDTLMLTLSGQFSTSNSFVIILRDDAYNNDQHYFGLGKFKNNELLSSIFISKEYRNFFLENSFPMSVDEMTSTDCCEKLSYILNESNVRIMSPVTHNHRLVGIIGLGEKVTGKPYTEKDLELLDSLITTITPFIVNTFLFMELSNINTWYLEILNNVQQGVFVFDRHNKLKNLNNTGFNILSDFKRQLKSKESLFHIPIQFIFSDSTFKNWAKRLIYARRIKHGNVLKNMVVKNERITKVFNVRLSDVVSDSEQDNDYVVTLEDITDQKESERELFELEKFADKGVMASSIAHELNNFLGLILGGVEIAEVNLSKERIDKTFNTFKKLKENVEKMKRFTAGLMDYTKLETSKSLASINKVITDVFSFVAVQNKFKAINMISDFDDNIKEIEIDKDQIAQLLLNFLNNAADAINESSSHNGQITVKTKLKENHIILSVADNGPGIKPEIKDKLFKTHLTTKEKGHGYGLVTCASIIDNHNASINIESQIGKGATFTISFPVKSSQQAK